MLSTVTVISKDAKFYLWQSNQPWRCAYKAPNILNLSTGRRWTVSVMLRLL